MEASNQFPKALKFLHGEKNYVAFMDSDGNLFKMSQATAAELYYDQVHDLFFRSLPLEHCFEITSDNVLKKMEYKPLPAFIP